MIHDKVLHRVDIIDIADTARRLYGNEKAAAIAGRPISEHDYRFQITYRGDGEVTFNRYATADEVAAWLEREGLIGSEDEQIARVDAERLIAEVGKVLAKMPKVVVLCGSTRFLHAFREANLTETLAGNIVLSIGCDMRTDTELFADLNEESRAKVKAQLDELHLRKIDLADEVLVLNVGGYVGDSTRREIDYAIRQGKPVRWLELGTPDTPEALAERMDSIRQTDETETPLADQLPASADDEGDETADTCSFCGDAIALVGDTWFHDDPDSPENHEATPANLAAA